VLRAPGLDTVLQVGFHQSRVEWQTHLSRPAGHTAFDAAQDTVGLLGCKCTLLGYVELLIYQHPRVLLSRAAFIPFIPQPVLIPGIALTHVQDLALDLVEPPEVWTGPLLKLVQVLLGGVPSLRYVYRTTQLGVICKLAEGALDPTESLMKILNSSGPIMDPWGKPLVTDLHLDIEPFTATLWM